MLIGALAMAVHNYPRQTEDLDLAIAVSPAQLAPIAEALRAEDWRWGVGGRLSIARS